MIKVETLVFSPFYVNTYLLFDETGECVIIDPGCLENSEKEEMKSFIGKNELKPVRLLNTHCHLDHVFGNHYVSETYGLKPEIHKAGLPVLNATAQAAERYGLHNTEPSPEPGLFLEEGDTVEFGSSTLDVLFVPGHSPGHLAFVNHEQKFVVQGDVLFYGSIGRTDFPGGDFNTLISSIKTKLLPLGDDFEVYSGHGPVTNIGFEKKNNPFLNQ